ncbi:MAG: pesticidal protein Cry7Aa [Flavobacteriales bacterium]|nr:pesticidal protein Cry7Aa [Flavobacteriales bacterium]
MNEHDQRVAVTRHGVLLDKTDLGFENAGALNPACIRVGGKVHIFYRAVRHGNYSTIGHCVLNGPLEVERRADRPILMPEHAYESQGMEDPRIVKIEDTYYMTYTGYDRTNALGTYATSKDLETFVKHGVITPRFTYREFKKLLDCCDGLNQKYLFHYKMLKEHGLGNALADTLLAWDKNLMFFPKKINGKFALLHRIHPGIQIVFFNDPEELDRTFWEHYLMDLERHIVLDPSLPHESSHIGGGAPPIETPEGWLLIYHAAEDTPHGFVYHACAALLDLEDPSKLIARLDHPLISPEEPYERTGYVKNIVFPSGAVVFGDDLYIYYGAADERVAVASVKVSELLQRLKENAP